MDNRLKEIRERLEGYSVVLKKDMMFLLDVIDGQQRQLEDHLEDQTNACLMCDKMDMAMLQSENEGLKQENKKLRAEANYERKISKQLKKNWQRDSQQLKESALRPATKFLGNDIATQLKHIKSEIWEIEQEVDYVDDIDKEKALDECNDGQISIETLKAIIEPDEQKRRESMIKTIKKNTDREGGSYYER